MFVGEAERFGIVADRAMIDKFFGLLLELLQIGTSGEFFGHGKPPAFEPEVRAAGSKRLPEAGKYAPSLPLAIRIARVFDYLSSARW